MLQRKATRLWLRTLPNASPDMYKPSSFLLLHACYKNHFGQHGPQKIIPMTVTLMSNDVAPSAVGAGAEGAAWVVLSLAGEGAAD